MFEQAQPEDLAFNSYHSLSDYNKFLTVQYAAFKKEVDKQIDSGKDLNWILETVREWNNKFYHARANDKRVLLHDHLYLAAEKTHTHQIDDIKLKVSGFLSTQKKILKEMIDYIEFKSEHSDTWIRLCWVGSLTDLMELIVAIWKLGVVRTITGEPATKKMLIKAFERCFGVKLKNHEMTQSKAITRKDFSPFLTRLKQCFDNFVRSKLK